MSTISMKNKGRKLNHEQVGNMLYFIEMLIPMALSFPQLVQWIDDLGGIEDAYWLLASLILSLGMGFIIFVIHGKVRINPFMITTGGYLLFQVLALLDDNFSYIAFSFALGQLFSFTAVRRVKSTSVFFQSDGVMLVSISISVFYSKIIRILDITLFQAITLVVLLAAYSITIAMAIRRNHGENPMKPGDTHPSYFAPLASWRTYLRGTVLFLFLAFSATSAAFSPILFETLFSLEFEQYFQTYVLTALYFAGFMAGSIIASLVAFINKRLISKNSLKITMNVIMLVLAVACIGIVLALVESTVVNSQAVLLLPFVFSLGIGLLLAHVFIAVKKPRDE